MLRVSRRMKGRIGGRSWLQCGWLVSLTIGLIAGQAGAENMYTEGYNVDPGGSGVAGDQVADYAVILESPYGVVYDFYAEGPGRRVWIEDPDFFGAVGGGPEGFYFGHNDMLPGPGLYECCQPPGDDYADEMTGGYLFNGFGRGWLWEPDNANYGLGEGELVTDFILGFSFTDDLGFLRETLVQSLDIGYASGSNLPTDHVFILGYRDAEADGFDRRPDGTSATDLVWMIEDDVIYESDGPTATHFALPTDPVHRIEIWREPYSAPFCPSVECPESPAFGWYTLDNVVFDTTGFDTNEDGGPGDYAWFTTGPGVYSGAAGIVPLPRPLGLASVGIGLLAVRGIKRRFSRRDTERGR